jgi:hypothetical protein
VFPGDAFVEQGSLWATLKDNQGALEKTEVFSKFDRNRDLSFAGDSAFHGCYCKGIMVRK